MFCIGKVLFISIQEEIDDKGISELIDAVSKVVRERGTRGVIIDLHNVEVVDTYLALHISKLADTVTLLRAKTIVTGLSVPVVLTLQEFGIHIPGPEFALDAEQALEKLEGIVD